MQQVDTTYSNDFYITMVMQAKILPTFPNSQALFSRTLEVSISGCELAEPQILISACKILLFVQFACPSLAFSARIWAGNGVLDPNAQVN